MTGLMLRSLNVVSALTHLLISCNLNLPVGPAQRLKRPIWKGSEDEYVLHVQIRLDAEHELEETTMAGHLVWCDYWGKPLCIVG